GHAAAPGERRTIPTCVGSTPVGFRYRHSPSDHPHVRGEHGPGRNPSTARGRTIPTCVGSTAEAMSTRSATEDHPHVRGEHAPLAERGMTQRGPSPRARGAPVPTPLDGPTARTIPTCVGSTGGGGGPRPPGADHPHVRGEHLAAIGVKGTPHGPSPHAWGAHLRRAHRIQPDRTIPTCVGSTSASTGRTARRPDHPHVR